ncbi:AMP-binding protein [Vibrio sp. PP-XX7]
MRFVNTNLAESCIRYGDHDALYCHDEVICYRQLAIRVEQVCQFIRDQSLVDQRIMIHLPKSIDYVVAIYAVLATGNSYVPIDASQPQERADMILEASQPVIGDHRKDLVSHYAGETMPVLTMDTISPMDEWFGPRTLEDAIMQWHRPHPDKIAAILFTSGSTGTPKGVQISHAMLSHFIEWSVTDLALSHNDVFSNHAFLCV